MFFEQAKFVKLRWNRVFLFSKLIIIFHIVNANMYAWMSVVYGYPYAPFILLIYTFVFLDILDL